MRRNRRFWGLGAVVTVAAALMLVTLASTASSDSAQHVRWDIISTTGIPPAPLNPGGHASATAANGGDTITLTGSGHFVAPASGGGSSGASGGGTWTTTGGGGHSGTYSVTGLVSWRIANSQTNVGFVDNIDEGTRTNGTAVLSIAFSDGSTGVLTVGCHGPGAPAGIFEGIATTKGFTTYYSVPAPVGGVDAGRTLFHVE